MRWRGRRQSSNVEDMRGRSSRRGFPGGGRIRLPAGRSKRAGFGGIGTIIIVLIISWLFGINPLTLLGGGGGGSVVPVQQQEARTPPANDELAQFVSVVLADTEDTWGRIFKQEGQSYPAPKLVLFSGQIQSACGFAQSASGPFYCPLDRKV